MSTKLMRDVSSDLLLAMKSGEVSPEGTDLVQLAVDLLQARHPDAPAPNGIEPLALLTGACVGMAMQRYADEA